MKKLFLLLAGLSIILLTGCGMGSIYTHTFTPLDINLNQTPASHLDGYQENIKQLHYYVDIIWDSNAIGDIYNRSGFSTIYYADLETFKILGLWNQYKVHVYGK
jgi:hypothetical protein